MIDGVNAGDGLARILKIAQIAEDRFDALEGIELAGAAGIARVDETANRMPGFQQPRHQVRADAARATGNQNLHACVSPLLI